jgi:hypothetical protein
MRTLSRYDILDRKVVHENGSFRRVKYWLRGWQKDPSLKHVGSCTYIQGLQGPETVVTVEEIQAIASVHVFAEMAAVA